MCRDGHTYSHPQTQARSRTHGHTSSHATASDTRGNTRWGSDTLGTHSRLAPWGRGSRRRSWDSGAPCTFTHSGTTRVGDPLMEVHPEPPVPRDTPTGCWLQRHDSTETPSLVETQSLGVPPPRLKSTRHPAHGAHTHVAHGTHATQLRDTRHPAQGHTHPQHTGHTHTQHTGHTPPSTRGTRHPALSPGASCPLTPTRAGQVLGGGGGQGGCVHGAPRMGAVRGW